MDDVPTAVLVIWWVTLVIAVVAIVPLTVYLLHRAFKAARQIEYYTARALEAGQGIATNTGNIAALDQTIAGASGALETTIAIEDHTGTIEQVLSSRAGGQNG